jgi:hypothetical protein
MNTIRSPFLPEMRAQSSGLVVFGQVLVLLELVDARLEQVRDAQARLVVVEEVLDRHLLGAVDDVLDHRAGVEVLEVQDLLVAVGVGDLEEAVLLGLGVHPLDGRLDHARDAGVAVAAELGEVVGVQRQLGGEVLARRCRARTRRPGARS